MADLPQLIPDAPWLDGSPLADQPFAYDTTIVLPDFIRSSWYAQPYVGAPFSAVQPQARSVLLADQGQPAASPDLGFIRWPQAEV